MIPLPTALMARFDECLTAKNISDKYHIHYKKWLRFYLDYCAKYQVEPTRRESLESFLQKLRDKKQTVMQQQQASHAVSLYYELTHIREPKLTSHVSSVEQFKVAEAVMPRQYVNKSVTQAGPAPETLKGPKEANFQQEHLRLAPISPSVAIDKVRPLTGASW